MSRVTLKELAAAVGRHASDEGPCETRIPTLSLYRSSKQTVSDAVVYSPSLCVVVQGAKEVIVEGQAHHYDPANSLLVSVDLSVFPHSHAWP